MHTQNRIKIDIHLCFSIVHWNGNGVAHRARMESEIHGLSNQFEIGLCRLIMYRMLLTDCNRPANNATWRVSQYHIVRQTENCTEYDALTHFNYPRIIIIINFFEK